MSVYYNFSQQNNTKDAVRLEQTDSSRQIILDTASDYKVSIVKFNLPNQIETFIIDNETDYVISYSFTTNTSDASAYVVPIVTQSLYKSSVFKMYSIHDFIENYNRSSLLAFKSLLTAADTYYDNVKSISASGSNATVTDKRDITLSITGSATMFCSYIKLAANIRGTSNKQNFEIQLIDPNGEKCIVGGGAQYANRTIEYEDGSIFSQNTTNVLVEDNYQPIEPFIKLCGSDTTQTGNWIVRVVNKNANPLTSFNISFSCTLTIYFSPVATNQSFFPRIPPSLDLIDDKFVFYLDDNTARTSFQVGLSPKLNQILTFPSVYDPVEQNYSLKLPQNAIQDSGLLKQYLYKQPLPTAFKAIDICEIQIRSNDLPVSGERSVSTSEAIICSIDVDTADLNNSVYQYSNSMLDDRSYHLTSNISLSKLNISVFVRYRSTNAVVPVFLPPFTTFNMLLKFIKM